MVIMEYSFWSDWKFWSSNDDFSLTKCLLKVHPNMLTNMSSPSFYCNFIWYLRNGSCDVAWHMWHIWHVSFILASFHVPLRMTSFTCSNKNFFVYPESTIPHIKHKAIQIITYIFFHVTLIYVIMLVWAHAIPAHCIRINASEYPHTVHWTCDFWKG